ncbi:MAG: putative entry exclusion protein TrbK-alt [Pseudomonadota bacterium]
MAVDSPPPIDPRRARCVLIALGLGTICAFAAALFTQAPEDRRSKPGVISRQAPLETTLLRCRALGDDALADAGCRAAWSEHRRRFMTRGARP